MLWKFSVKKYGMTMAKGLPFTSRMIFPSQILAAAVSGLSLIPIWVSLIWLTAY